MATTEKATSISQELTDAIRKEVVQKTATYSVVAFIALLGISVAGWGFYISNRIPDWVGVPKGAVVAFDLTDGCPSGWISFDDASGRFVIGAGQGKGLADRTLRAIGGAETTRLSVDQLPPKQIHVTGLVGQSRTDKFNAGGRDYPVLGMTDGTYDVGGSGNEVTIMPPFIALHFCKKS